MGAQGWDWGWGWGPRPLLPPTPTPTPDLDGGRLLELGLRERLVIDGVLHAHPEQHPRLSGATALLVGVRAGVRVRVEVGVGVGWCEC